MYCTIYFYRKKIVSVFITFAGATIVLVYFTLVNLYIYFFKVYKNIKTILRSIYMLLSFLCYDNLFAHEDRLLSTRNMGYFNFVIDC